MKGKMKKVALLVLLAISFTVTAAAGGAALSQKAYSTQTTANAEENNCADLHFSEDYRFLYGSNRGHNSIVIYSVCPESGKLALVGHCSTDGKTPRNFTLTEDGEWLLAANQDSNSVVSLKVNKETGLLEQKSKLEIPAPVWLGIR